MGDVSFLTFGASQQHRASENSDSIFQIDSWPPGSDLSALRRVRTLLPRPSSVARAVNSSISIYETQAWIVGRESPASGVRQCSLPALAERSFR